MNTLFGSRSGTQDAGVVAILMVASAVHAQIPCGYEVTAVIQGPWCPIFGFPPTTGRAFTQDGAVVGHYTSCDIGPSEAFWWTPESGLVTLERPPGYASAAAWDSSDPDWIVGGMTAQGSNVSTATLWSNGVAMDLGTLPGGNFSQARATNGVQIVGKWGNSVTGPIHGFIWEDGVMTDLGPDLGTPSSRTNDICKATGQVVGWMGSGFMQDGEAYIWDNGSVIPLGPIPGGFFSIAESINRHSEVVGWGLVEAKGFPAGQTRGFLWRQGKMIELPPLPGFALSAATDLNDATVVVGTAWGPGASQTGFIWSDAVMVDLNDLIAPEAALEVTIPWAINQQGQITGQAHNDQLGDVVAFLLTPIESPAGDLDGDCAVDILDVLILLSSWGRCADPPDPCPGDLDGDGSVGIIDLLTLLANWG